jgi:hypothetical protein
VGTPEIAKALRKRNIDESTCVAAAAWDTPRARRTPHRRFAHEGGSYMVRLLVALGLVFSFLALTVTLHG